MEIYNPALEEKEESNSKSKMEILTEYILEELNSFIEDQKKAYKYIPVFKKWIVARNK